MTSGRIKVLAMAAVLVLLLAACGEDDGSGAGGGSSPTEQASSPEPTESESEGDEEEGEYTVEAADSDLGQIVTDSEGRTVYVFMADTSSESTCYDDCAATWPAVTVEGEPSAEGIDASLLGTTDRTDGSTQLTLNGHPLYYYAADSAPGDTNGQGIGDVWFVVSPEGEPIQS